MTPDETNELALFRQLLDDRGADPKDWNNEQRIASARLLQQSTAAREELKLAQILASALTNMPAHTVTAGLESRILQAVATSRTDRLDRFINWFTAAFWRPVVLMSSPLLVGVWLGLAQPGMALPLSALVSPTDTPPSVAMATELLDEVYARDD